MKRLYVASCVLALSIVMLVTAAAPAKATQPTDTGESTPVAWVSWGGSNSRVKDEFHQAQLSFLVKKLGDGTTLGHMWYRDRVTGAYTSSNILDSYFHEADGAKVAEIFTSAPYGVHTMYHWWILTDGGEPGAANDGFQLYAFFVPNGVPLVPAFSPPGPPGTVNPPTWPGWWQFEDQAWIPGGNIQIHMTDACED